MGDALCGPSNPLQNFRKQTQADRSLQQDRLASRNQPAQGFRSSPGSNAGILDAEFEAFQNGAPLALHPQDLHYAPPHVPQALQQQPFHAGPAAGGWATDFQRLQISQQPSPQQQQHQQQNNLSSWHNDFMQQSQRAPLQHAPAANYQPQLYQPRTSGLGYMSPGPMLSNNGQYLDNSMTSKGKQPEAFDDAAFEREFQMHASQALQTESLQTPQEAVDTAAQNATAEQQKTNASHAERHIDRDMDHLKEWANALEQNDLEQDLHDRTWARSAEATAQNETPQHPQPNIDADLARTAGELLERVADDDSEKFQKSEFFSLMRRVRDGQATIQDGRMLDDVRTLSPSFHAPDDWDKD